MPLFDDQSTLRAAPVVPLERVARRRSLARFAAGDWRERMRSPRFRRSWPLALLLVATLAAAVAATSLYRPDDLAQTTGPAAGAVTASDTAADARASTGAEKAITPSSRGGDEPSRDSRDARISRDAAGASGTVTPTDNTDALAASALGNAPTGDDGAADQDNSTSASGDDERSGGRDKGRRGKPQKRRQNARRGNNGGGAILFGVIR